MSYRFSMHLTLPVLLLAVLLAACGADPEPTTVTDASAADVTIDTVTADDLAEDTLPEAQPRSEREQALEVALDSLEALVLTLERIEGPIAAWNRAGEAARLLRYLEQNRSTFALDMTEEEAALRYPEQIERLQTLEARRAAELERINEDPVAMQVLTEEMAKAEAEAAGE